MAVTDLSPSPLIVKALHNKRGHRFHPTTYMKWLLGKVLNTLTAWTFWMEVRSMVWRKVLNATATVLTKHPSIHELYQPHTRCGFREMVCLAPNPLWVHALSFTPNFCRRFVVFLEGWERVGMPLGLWHPTSITAAEISLVSDDVSSLLLTFNADVSSSSFSFFSPCVTHQG